MTDPSREPIASPGPAGDTFQAGPIGEAFPEAREAASDQGLLSEAEAMGPVEERSRRINELLAAQDYHGAWEEARSLRRFIAGRCASTPEMDRRLTKMEAILDRLTECGYDASNSGAGRGTRSPSAPVWSISQRTALRILACAGLALLVVVIPMWVTPRWRGRPPVQTPVGRLRLPSSPTAQGGDASEGWCGSFGVGKPQWLLVWRHHENAPDRSAWRLLRFLLDVAAMQRIPSCRVLTATQEPKALVEASTHSKVSWPFTMNRDGLHPGATVSWHCPDTRRVVAFYTWRSREDPAVEPEVEAAALAPDCHPGQPAPALALPRTDMPADYQQVGEDVLAVRFARPGSDGLVFIGKGEPGHALETPLRRNLSLMGIGVLFDLGRFYPLVLETAPVLPPVAALPHPFRTHAGGISRGDTAAGGQAYVVSSWYCDTADKVYFVGWLGNWKSRDELIRDPLAAQACPSFVRSPRCIDGCGKGGP